MSGGELSVVNMYTSAPVFPKEKLKQDNLDWLQDFEIQLTYIWPSNGNIFIHNYNTASEADSKRQQAKAPHIVECVYKQWDDRCGGQLWKLQFNVYSSHAHLL